MVFARLNLYINHLNFNKKSLQFTQYAKRKKKKTSKNSQTQTKKTFTKKSSQEEKIIFKASLTRLFS